jgi:primosomal protein N' (replication factor Y)
VVFELTDQPDVDVPRPIISTVESSPLVSDVALEIARWMSRYYRSSLFEAVALFLPPGFKGRVDAYLEPQGSDPGRDSLSQADEKVLLWVEANPGAPEARVRKTLDAQGKAAVDRLVRRGLLQRMWRLPHPRTAPRYEALILSTLPLPDGKGGGEALVRRAPRQSDLLQALMESKVAMSLTLARKEYGSSAVRGLESKGLLVLEWVRTDAAVQGLGEGAREQALTLTPEQKRVVDHIVTTLRDGSLSPDAVLVHGVTGSGKTEVYLRALEACIALGRRGIYMVPEIALTPQIVHRLNARFPGRVALMHSGLSQREQFDYWWRIRDGSYDVVVGPRSALFTPVPNLGLIAMDEEHEWAYKEQERSPRYHARDVALRLARLCSVPMVMGSATPDVTTYYEARQGRHSLFDLPYRVGSSVGDGDAGLAAVEVVDMRQELKEGNRSLFSRALAQGLKGCVERGEQAVLLLNRRGSATLVQCRDCGLALHCRRCSVTLTYHRSRGLLCHHCNRRTRPPAACPSCHSPRIRYLGTGTQRVVEEMEELMPQVRVIRWDSDSAREPGGHTRLMDDFAQGRGQVLVGTQMVAKGLHVPNVSLVGVVLADVGLHHPDFRAGERTFQLLCQVAGRAGRGPAPGQVIIQTYSPENYAIKAAALQDYQAMYQREMEERRRQGTPPLGRLVHMTYLHTNEAACHREAARWARALRSAIYGGGVGGLDVVGPAPAHPQRVRGRYRWHVILRGPNPQPLLEKLPLPKGWILDVDPVSVL